MEQGQTKKREITNIQRVEWTDLVDNMESEKIRVEEDYQNCGLRNRKSPHSLEDAKVP